MILFASAPSQSSAEPAFRDLAHEWHNDIVDFVRHDAPKILVILLLAFVLTHTVSFFVKRMRGIADTYVGNARRASQLRTVAAILRATSYGVIGFIVLLQVLPLFNIDLKPLLASAGVVGLGISFGAQSIFKDMLNGIFILIEDQFSVGDVVKVAGLQGSVEDLSLRVTTIRDGDGTLYFIPNSQITTISNLSREYSVASLSLSVDSGADPDRVMGLLRQVAQQVRQDAAFREVAVSDPDVLGVDRISGREVFYPVNIRVKANQRDGVLRELRKRLLLAFAKEGIALGVPASIVLTQAAHEAAGETAQPPV